MLLAAKIRDECLEAEEGQFCCDTLYMRAIRECG